MRTTRAHLIHQANDMRARAERFMIAGDKRRSMKYLRLAKRFEDAASKL